VAPEPLPSAQSRALAVVGLVIAFGWTLLLAGRTHSLADVHQDLVTIAAEWIVVVILAAIAFGLQGRRSTYFHLALFTGRDLGAMLAAFVSTYLVVGLVSAFVPLPTSSLDVRLLGQVPVLVRVALVLTAGICEEFIFRGFGIEELASLVGSWPLAGVVSWIAFTLAHIDRYGWSPGLLIPAIAGGMLTLLYFWRRNLPLCMLLHILIDGISVLLAPMLMRH
jgi:CAAX protease family protein